MGALRVAFERGESSDGLLEGVEVLGSRQGINGVEHLEPFNLDLAETVIHRVHARIVDGCVVVTGAGGGIDQHRGQAVAKRVHSRTRLAFFTAGAATFSAITLVCCDLPLRRHGTYFRDANTAASF